MIDTTFCTCSDTRCAFHPKNQADGCAPCIKKNLARNEIPTCFWHNANVNPGDSSDYTFTHFARLIIDKGKGEMC